MTTRVADRRASNAGRVIVADGEVLPPRTSSTMPFWWTSNTPVPQDGSSSLYKGTMLYTCLFLGTCIVDLAL